MKLDSSEENRYSHEHARYYRISRKTLRLIKLDESKRAMKDKNLTQFLTLKNSIVLILRNVKLTAVDNQNVL